jgi:hypothetical protein
METHMTLSYTERKLKLAFDSNRPLFFGLEVIAAMFIVEVQNGILAVDSGGDNLYGYVC